MAAGGSSFLSQHHEIGNTENTDITATPQGKNGYVQEDTPTKLLEKISPIPMLQQKSNSKRKQSAMNLTNENFISLKRNKEKEEKKEQKTSHKKCNRRQKSSEGKY